MALLSKKLIGVIDALPASVSQDVVSQYRQKIPTQADALDSASQTSGDSSANPASLACKASHLLFGDRTVTANDPGYKELQRVNWSMTSWLPAKCIIRILNTVEVALALKIITHFSCPFAIRSGGHQANPGFGSIGESGILLDLGTLNSTELSSDHKVASLGPGARWGDVYEMLEQQKLNVVGGRIAEVGVGGLILGGGMSHFSSEWGLVCDHVKNFKVVLSDSTVVQANAEENADLFLALKGGGPNFGIVTRFDLYTNVDYQMWYTLKVYSTEKVEVVMKAAVSVELAMESDPRIGFFLTTKADVLVAGMLYMGEAPSKDVFEAFDDIEAMVVVIPEKTGTQLSLARALSMAGETKREVGTAAVRPDAELYIDLYRVVQGIQPAPSCSYGFTIQPVGPAAPRKSKHFGGNCVDVPSESHSWLAITCEWTDASSDDLAREDIRELISKLQSTAEAKDCLLDFQFMNDAFYTQSPLKTLRKDTLEFLKETSRKYDPDGVFRRLQNAGFLLSKA